MSGSPIPTLGSISNEEDGYGSTIWPLKGGVIGFGDAEWMVD